MLSAIQTYRQTQGLGTFGTRKLTPASRHLAQAQPAAGITNARDVCAGSPRYC